MIFHYTQGFWKRRGIESIDEDSAMQRLHDREPELEDPQAGATPWSTVHDTPPSEEEDQQ